MLPAIEGEVKIPIKPGSQDAEELAATALVRGFRARPLPREGDWSVYAIGSRVLLRIWGLWGQRAYRRLPLKVRMRVLNGEDAATILLVQLLNDEGQYLVRLPMVEVAYRRYYREIIEKLELEVH